MLRGGGSTIPNMAPTTNRAEQSTAALPLSLSLCLSASPLSPLYLCGRFVSAFWATVTNQLLLLLLLCLGFGFMKSICSEATANGFLPPGLCVANMPVHSQPGNHCVGLFVHFVSPFSVHFLCQFAFLFPPLKCKQNSFSSLVLSLFT